jgi:broad specificity phosphatase PhoE
MSQQQQRTYLVRYGLRACDLVPFVGPFDMGLHEEGVLTAEELGAFLMIQQQQGGRPLSFFASPFRRSLTTAAIAASKLNDNEKMAKVNVEQGCSEWYSPSLVSPDNYIPPPQDSEDWYADLPQGMIDKSYASIFPVPTFEESEEALITRCDAVVRRLASLHYDKDIVLISHAPCLLAFALSLSGETPEKSTIRPWVLGGVTSFVRRRANEDDQGDDDRWEWDIELDQHVGHLTGDAAKGIQAWTLPCLEK